MKSKKELTIPEKITKEERRFRRIFKNIDKDKFDTCIKLIQNASFMSVQMDDMQERINVEGVTIKYQNGEKQWGYKKSPDVETYNSFIKQYTTIIKQLTDLLPKEETDITAKEIAEMLNKPK